MKNIKLTSISSLAAVALLASCGENTWNEDYLDGFKVPEVGVPDQLMTVNYELTNADYIAIATNSTNKALAEQEGETEALAEVATNFSFPTPEMARKYIPAFLGSTSFPLFTMSDGESVKVHFNSAANVAEEVRYINSGAKAVTLSEADYKKAWESDDNYINGFAPMLPASKNIPSLLKGIYPDAKVNDYAVVSYNEATVNPIFGSVGDGGNEQEWTPSSVLGSAALNDDVKVSGYVTGICSRGFILTDNSGSILCYQASGFDVASVTIGSQVDLSGTVSAYNKGLQIAITGDEYTVVGTGEYTYPTPTVYTGTMMDQAITRTENALAQYVQITGKVSISGNYYNIEVEGAETAIGSGYMVPDFVRSQLEDGKTYTLTGYYMAISGGKYFNMVITGVNTPASKVVRRAPAGEVATSVKYGVYMFDGSKWIIPENTYVLQPEDYTALGRTSDLNSSLYKTLIPEFLKQKYPYAGVMENMTVVYRYYNGSETVIRASEYDADANNNWKINEGEITEQYTVNDGVWSYNPSVVITLPYSRNTDPSYTYYMAIVNWVFENVALKYDPDDTLTSGNSFIDYRGNAEFYSGASAFYGNVDVRASSAKSHIPEGYTEYDGLTDDEITLLMKKRFTLETLPAALEQLHADAMPVDGMEITYTVNFTAYNGAASSESIVYTVAGPGKFAFKSCTETWVDEATAATWK